MNKQEYEERRKEICGKLKDYADSHFQTARGHDRYVCPFCGQGEGSDRPAFYIRTSKAGNMYYTCKSCNAYGNMLTLIAYENGLDIDRDYMQVFRLAAQAVDVILPDDRPRTKEEWIAAKNEERHYRQQKDVKADMQAWYRNSVGILRQMYCLLCNDLQNTDTTGTIARDMIDEVQGYYDMFGATFTQELAELYHDEHFKECLTLYEEYITKRSTR